MKKRNLFTIVFLTTCLSSCSIFSFLDKNKSSEEIITEETTYECNEWDAKVIDMLSFTVGEDMAEVIPSFNATNYYVSIGTEGNGDSKILFTDIKCYPTSATADANYQNKLSSVGFIASAENPYSYYKASVTDDLIVQYDVLNSNDTYILEILAYRVSFRYADWPTTLTTALLGFDLPIFVAESYDVDLDPYTLRGSIYCNNVPLYSDDSYAETLRNEGFIVSNKSLYGYTITSADGWINIELYNTYTSYEENCLLIRFVNDWPYLEINSYLDEDLPKYEKEGVSFDYTYTELSDGSEVLTLYFDNTELNDYYAYCALINDAGWTLDDSIENNHGESTSSTGTVYYSYLAKKKNGQSYYIDVMYADYARSIAVAIY